MKFKISMLFALIMSFYLNAQENIAQVEFETKLIDYGDIEFDSDGKRVFKFKNVGLLDVDKPIFINNQAFIHSLVYTGKSNRAVLLAYGNRKN